jgi:ribonuclease P protein component
MSPVVADRLRDGRAISAVLRGRRKRAGERLIVHVLERSDEHPARLAVVASRRVGGAVQRNRAKRLLREAARSRSWVPGIDVVLVARAACARSGLEEVRRDLDAATSALGVVGDQRVEVES